MAQHDRFCPAVSNDGPCDCGTTQIVEVVNGRTLKSEEATLTVHEDETGELYFESTDHIETLDEEVTRDMLDAL